MSIEKRALSGSITGAANFGVTLLQSLVTVPLLLHYWGEQQYGTWIALSAAVALLSSLDLGHQNYVGNEFNRDMAEARVDRLRLNLTSGVRLAWFLGGVQFLLAVAVVLTGHTDSFLGLPDNTDQDGAAGFAFLMLVGNWFVFGSISGLLVRLYAPHGKFARAQMIGIVQRLFLFAILLVVALTGGGLRAYAYAFTAYSVIFACVWLPELKRTFPHLYPWWRGGDWKISWRNFKSSLVLTFNGVLAQFSTNGLNLLIAGRLAATAVPGFSTVRTLANTAYQASLVLIQPLVPDLVRFHLRADWSKLVAALQGAWLAGGLIINVGLLLAAPFLPWFFGFWTRGRLELNLDLLGLLMWSVALRNAYAPLTVYLAGLNDLRAQLEANIVQAVVTLGLPLLLIRSLGLTAFGWGVALGEAGALAMTLRAVRRHGGLWSGDFPRLFTYRALVPALIVGMILAFSLRTPGLARMAAPAGAVVLVLLYLAHWKTMPAEMRRRMTRVLPVIGPSLANRFSN